LIFSFFSLSIAVFREKYFPASMSSKLSTYLHLRASLCILLLSIRQSLVVNEQ